MFEESNNKKEGLMIVQNCLNLLKDLHQIEEEIKNVKAVLSEKNIDIDEERLINELIKKRLNP